MILTMDSLWFVRINLSREKMYLMYVDESGDIGLTNSHTNYFCLSGIVVHESTWRDTLDQIIAFRKQLRTTYGLNLNEELHASEFIHSPGALARIGKSMRLRILRDAIDFEASLNSISILNVVVDKTKRTEPFDVFEMGWQTLIQRFENTIKHENFPPSTCQNDRGLLFVDNTDVSKLRGLTRKMGKYNPVPGMYGGTNLKVPNTRLIEDAIHRSSNDSYFVQLADINAYFLQQKHNPCKYVERKGAKNYFLRLGPVLCKHASHSDPNGIVYRQ